MDGPRTIRPEEFSSLSTLVDTVFRPGQEGEMFRLFPTFLTESNRENIFVFADDDGTIVSHLGMALRWVSIEGCTIPAAAIGAVATYELHRGRGLASQLLKRARCQAREWGADFMMISGGRGLYRRVGAADVGSDVNVAVDRSVADALRDASSALHPLERANIPDCAVLYARRGAHYLRARDDWRAFIDLKVCMCKEFDPWTVRRGGVVCAYLVVHDAAKHDRLEVLEFAGDTFGVSAALPELLDRYGRGSIDLHLEPGDRALHAVLTGAAAPAEPAVTSGTMLLLDVPRLVDRLQPLFRARLGRTYPDRLTVHAGSDGSFEFALGSTRWTAPSVMEAAQFLFGHPEHPPRLGGFKTALPVSTVWYGLDYV